VLSKFCNPTIINDDINFIEGMRDVVQSMDLLELDVLIEDSLAPLHQPHLVYIGL
jgi:hypothetical protein